MIEVERLTKRYGPRTAVENVSFRVRKGEIVGFLGPNGAGKSTTLRMLTGFLAPSAGTIRIDGIDLADRPEDAKRRIGYMPEGCPLYPELRVNEYLAYRAELKGVPRAKIAARVSTALEQASVTEVATRIIGQLSKGTRQRVGLADALVADPPLLVLDEPTAGLDPNQIRQVRKLVRGLGGEKTVLVSTHILPEVEATCGRVVIIDRGKVVGEGTPGELRGRSAHQRALLIACRADAEKLRALLGAVSGVTTVGEPDEERGVVRVTLRTEDDEAIAERVFAAVAGAGLALRELRPIEGRSLEDVFTHLTTHDAASDAKDEADAKDEGAKAATDDEDDDEEGETDEPSGGEREKAS